VGEITVLPEWKAFLERLLREKGDVLVIGEPDTGKSTFAKFLITSLFQAGVRTAYVDSDIGQTTLGPPGTIAMKAFCELPTNWERLQPDGMKFLGAVSPMGHLLEFLVAIKRLAEKAHSLGAEVTVFDTTGFIQGDVARQLKLNKIDLLQPRYVVAFQRNQEIELLLQAIESRQGVDVFRMSPFQGIQPRSRETRRLYRERRFLAYFQKSHIHQLPIQDFYFDRIWFNSGDKIPDEDLEFLSKALNTPVLYGIKNWEGLHLLVKESYSKGDIFYLKNRFQTSELHITEIRDLQDLLLGLNNGRNETLALGILIDFKFPQGQEADPKQTGSQGYLIVKTPLKDLSEVRIIQVGNIHFQVV